MWTTTAGNDAALTAARAGASVAVLEKQPRHGHISSTRMSGGLVMAASDVVCRELQLPVQSGDDTILIVCPDREDARKLAGRIEGMLA